MSYPNQPEIEALQVQLNEREQLAAELKIRARQQAAVAELGQRALVGTGLAILLDEAVSLVAKTLGLEYTAVMELLPDRDRLLLRAGWGWPTDLIGQASLEIDARSQVGYTLLERSPVIIENIARENYFSQTDLLRDREVLAGMTVLIQSRDEPFGVLGAYATCPRSFSEDDTHFLQAIANVLATAIERKRAETQIIQRNRELLILQSASATITSSLDLEHVLHAVTGEMVNLLNVESCAIFDWNQVDHSISLLAEYPPPQQPFATAPQRYQLDRFPHVDYVLTEQRIWQTTLTKLTDPTATAFEFMQARRLKTIMLVPMIFQGRVMGLVNIMDSRLERTFTNQEIALAKLLANQAASAIENARLHTQTRRMLKEQLALREAGAIIASSLNLEVVLTHIAEQIGQAIDVTSAYILNYDPDTSLATVLAEYINPHFSPQEQPSILGARYNLYQDFPDTVDFLRGGQPKITHQNDPHLSETERSRMQKFGIKTILTMPMLMGERLIAYAELWESRRSRKFTEDEIRLCQDTGRQAAIAIENARLHTETEQRAEQLAVLQELDRAITVSLRISDVYHAFARHASRLLPYDHMSITLLEADHLRVTYSVNQQQESKPLPVGSRLPRQASAAGWVVAQGQPLLRHNIAQDPRFAEDKRLVAGGIQAHIIMPLRIQGQVIGTWNIGSTQLGMYTPNDLKTVQAMTDQLAIAIANARSFEQAQQEIVERKRAEAALEEERALLARRVAERTADLSAANVELAKAARLKDEFLASMSHELRTPLTAILGLCELLKLELYGELSAKQRRSILNIEESGRHLLALINDILDLSKIEAGKLDLELANISIEAACQASLQFVKQAAHRKHLKISFTLDSSLTVIYADERRLKQILVNLLSNAVKFTPDHGAIGLEVTGDSELNQVHFTVWDTGIGISEADQARLFQPFIQLDSSLSRQHSGTGLGLTLVHRMVTLHEGGVVLESQVGEGSRFTFSLPWYASTRPDEAAPLDPDFKDYRPLLRHALIIDDSPTAAEQLARYLRRLGISTTIHHQGQNAVETVRESRPDLVILDLLLPDVSGWEILERLKADPQTHDIPVLVVSAMDKRRQGLSAGAAEYLVKPIGLPQLEAVLRQIAATAPAGKVISGAAAQTTPVSPDPISTNIDGPLVLIAEDEVQIATFLSDYLQALGYRILIARNGREALAQAQQHQPDIILMDIQMPEMDGLQAMRAIRADEQLQAVPIVALTALVMPGDRERFLAAGANAYLSKPVNWENLIQTLETQLKKSSHRDDHS